MSIPERYTDITNRFVQNSEEFNRIWRELNFIIKSAEFAVTRALDGVQGEVRYDQYGIDISSAGEGSRDFQLEIGFRPRADLVVINFRKNGKTLEGQADYNLDTLKEAYRQRGAILYLAERFCSRWGRRQHLVSQLSRFSVSL